MTGPVQKEKGAASAKTFVVGALAALIVIAFGTGFLVLPILQKHSGSSMHSAVQHALGHTMRDAAPVNLARPSDQPTDIVWNEETIHAALSGDPKRGEKITSSCTACHGERGVASEHWIPTLAGINRIALYKQLMDYRSEKRLFGPMPAIAQSLSPEEIADVAAFYSGPTGIKRTSADDQTDAPVRSYRAKDPTIRLIYAGDPKRGIPGCSTCHGPGAYRLGVPGLAGQNAAYLNNQLDDFAQGIRHNDMNMPMRTVAQLLTKAERLSIAEYYAGMKTDAVSANAHVVEERPRSTE